MVERGSQAKADKWQHVFAGIGVVGAWTAAHLTNEMKMARAAELPRGVLESHNPEPGKQHSQTIAEAAVPKACRPVGDGPHTTLDVAESEFSS